MEDQPRQLTWAVMTRKLRDPFSTWGPLTAQVLRVVMLVLLSSVLLLMAGLTLAGTLIGLAVTAPLLVLFSPVLVPAALTIGLVVTGFLTSVALVLTALFFFTRVNSLRKRMGERHTISGGDHEDARASNSLTSSERTDFWPSAPVHVTKESVIVDDQQQQNKNGRMVEHQEHIMADPPTTSGQHEDPKASGSLSSLEPSDCGQSASLTSVTGNNYHVFLSFRGADTRKGFINHLSNRIKDVGLKFDPNLMFRDDEKIEYGSPIAETLMSAIMNSKISIPVISPDYASSEWCLRELIHIMECRESRRQIVLPVLYRVKPHEVRYLLNTFGDAFRRREHRFDEELKKQGPIALRKAVDSKVFESDEFAHGREGELVNALVEIVMRKLQEDFQPRLPANLVRIDDHVAKVMTLVDTAYPETRIIGIYGISGIGKTTLATIIYKKLFDKFECRSFLKDIRETIKSEGIKHLQSRLISDLLKIHKHWVPDSEIGINTIRVNCSQKKVLILLDDVAHQDHLNNLIGDCSFMPGSRILVTCRDKKILESKYGYELQVMNPKDSLDLFSRYAFEGKEPPKDFMALSSDIVATTGGLPLALVIIGSLLKRKDKSIWTETLEKLRKVPHTDVQQKLRISYDSLEYEEQQIFLDIACFFIGIDKRIATYLWKDLEWHVDSGLARMIELSLIKYDDNNELRMHDQLRDLGKAIARPANKKPWDCSRLWDKEAMKVLGRKKVNEIVEALRLDKEGSSKFMKQESFKELPELKFLHVKAVDFAGNFEKSLSELRWLKWERCPDSFEVTHIHLENLLILDLSDGFISANWRGWSSIEMERLKVLNLSNCLDLKSTPNLSRFKNLEMLILENCENLEETDPSIGDVKFLVSLNLRHCESLEMLPAELGELEELKELLIDETDIREIPASMGSLEKLKMLSAVGCRLLTRVPSSIICLVSLLTLNLNTCRKLQELPDSFEARGKLQRLLLERCYMLRVIPSSIGELGELEELDLSSTRIRELPESIGKMDKLKILRISHSTIERLPSAIGKLKSLQELDASGCHKLVGQVPEDIGGLSSLKTLRLGRAKISGLPENFDQLSALEHLDLLYCGELQSLPKPPLSLSSLQLTCWSDKLPSLSHLSHLKELTLRSCMSLQCIPELPSCLEKLRVWKCPKLERLPNLSHLESLSELELLQCYGLKKLDGLEALNSLRKLNVSTSTELSNLDDFEDLESLRYLDLQSYDEKADNLHVIGGLEKLGSLEVLNICGRKHIQQLDLSQSEQLKGLIVNNCESLDDIRFHNSIKSLDRFDTDGCKSHIPRLLPRDST